MKTIFENCEPRPEVLQGALREEIFAARLKDVIEGTADPVYQDPTTFFDNTYPTEGLKLLLDEALGRLTGVKPANNAIVRLETAFGGGKTHNLIGLYHAASAGFHLKNINGNPRGNSGTDVLLSFGPGGNAGWHPLTGNWDGLSQAGLSAAGGVAAVGPDGQRLDPLAVDRTVGSSQLLSNLAEVDFPCTASGPGGQDSDSQRHATNVALDALLGDELLLSSRPG